MTLVAIRRSVPEVIWTRYLRFLGSLSEDFHQTFDDAIETVRGQLGRPTHLHRQARKVSDGAIVNSPIDTRIVLGSSSAQCADAAKAIAAAREAFPAWRDLGWQGRVVLRKPQIS
jgi:delta 1-pyrroline-5-carboxylate dehydrogenase